MPLPLLRVVYTCGIPCRKQLLLFYGVSTSPHSNRYITELLKGKVHIILVPRPISNGPGYKTRFIHASWCYTGWGNRGRVQSRPTWSATQSSGQSQWSQLLPLPRGLCVTERTVLMNQEWWITPMICSTIEHYKSWLQIMAVASSPAGLVLARPVFIIIFNLELHMHRYNYRIL